MRFHPGQHVVAAIERSVDGTDSYRLYAFIYDGRERKSYLGEDGLWHDVHDDYALQDPAPGLPVPHGMKAALVSSLFEHMDAGAEKELRETLAVERRRVDALLDKVVGAL